MFPDALDGDEVRGQTTVLAAPMKVKWVIAWAAYMLFLLLLAAAAVAAWQLAFGDWPVW